MRAGPGAPAGAVARVVAFGDSLSCGEGVGLRVPSDQVWPARLAAALPGSALTLLAAPGARVRDVRAVQLPACALDPAVPTVATLVVGLNDVLRGGFEPERFAADLAAVLDALRAAGVVVLLGALHDPCALLPLPAAVRTAVARRLAAVDVVLRRPREDGVLLLDLARLPALRTRAGFAVDRLHPNTGAHQAVAAHAADLLRRAGVAAAVVAEPSLPAAPGALATAWWGARHGLPWLVARRREVALPALATALGR